MATMTDLSAVRTFVNASVRNVDRRWGDLVATMRVRNIQAYQGGLAEEVDAWAIEQLVAQEYPHPLPRRPAPPPPRP